jgi:hypothetical protein
MYQTGPDDPALAVTERDKRDVEEVLDRQEALDRQLGLRAETPVPRATVAAVAAGAPVAPAGGEIDYGPFRAIVPEGWIAETPRSVMGIARLGQFRLPAAPGDRQDGEIAITSAGGSVGDNLARWFGQFEQLDGSDSAAAAKTETMQVDGMNVTLVDLAGTMKASTMPMAGPQTPLPDWRLLGAIVETGAGSIFIKGTGPDATMGAHREKMVAFLNSIARPGSVRAGGGERVATHTEAPPTSTSIPPAAPPATRKVAMAMLDGTPPENWIARPAGSSMRAAEFVIPRAEGDPADGELIVYYFGAGQGGGVQENIERWQGQMIQPDGRPVAEATRQNFLQAGDITIVTIDVPGTFTPAPMPGMPAGPPMPNARMLAAVAIVDRDNSLYFKAVGPERTMTLNRGRFEEFLKSLGRR